MKVLQSLFFTTVLVIAVAPPVHADTSSPVSGRHAILENPWFVSMGAFIIDKQLQIRVNGSTTIIDDKIDFGEQWRFDNNETSFAGELRWRFGEKWSVSAQYFGTRDASRAILDEDVEWGDYTFKVGTNVGAGIGFDIARVFFGRTFSEGQNYEFGAGLGFHWMEIEAWIDGEAFINDQSTGIRRESVDAAAPLPNLGAWYRYAFSSKWLATARIDWLDVDFDEYGGQLLNSSLAINYMLGDHLGVTLAYQYFGLDVDVDASSWRGSIDLSSQGPFLSLTATW